MENGTEDKPKGDFVSDEKRQIAEEEKEKMIRGTEEKGVKLSEVEKKRKALEEAAMGDVDKRRIPIGGIKIPGFLKTTRSREKTKEGDDNEEGADLLEQPCTEVRVNEEKEKEAKSENTSRLPLFDKFANLKSSFMKKKSVQQDPTDNSTKETEESNGLRRPNLINAIRLPLANLVPKKKTKDEEEIGTQAGLASMETLDDDSKHDDGMENIILESVDIDPEKAGLEDEQEEWKLTDWEKHWEMVKQHKVAASGILIFMVLFLVLIITVLAGPRVNTHAPIIEGKYIKAITTCGFVEGLIEDNAFVFRGIPYANPPTGPRRFRPPEPQTLEECWDGVFKAHNQTSSCWQIYGNSSLNGDEDCLTLEVYTPQVQYENPLPVIVVIGSDSLLGGWPGGMHPSTKLSHAKEVVIVRPNFRLGTLGFLAAKALSDNRYPRTSGNYGLADVIRALEWTNINIRNFGGDKNHITVVGHRAGATLVTALTSILKPEKLFQRVWISSGTTVFPNMTLREAEKQSEEYINGLDCNINTTSGGIAECLTKMEIEDLLDAIPDSWRRQKEGVLPVSEVKGHQWLVEDGIHIRQHPFDAWSKKNLTVQVVIGTTLHSETSFNWWQEHKTWTEERIIQEVNSSQIGAENLLDRVKGLYNLTVEGYASLVTDISTLCPLLNMHKQIPYSKFYLVTQPSDESGLSYGGTDIDAVIGPYQYQLDPPARRYLSSMRKVFFRYVSLGIPPDHKYTKIDQDVSRLDIQDLETKCTFWKEAGFDKFARVD
ncbi:neurotactin [Cimex lectularius]|uniref:Carboxylesterase type B domain-containing protein n=1 Tax=Cimex lectularius TaxID=79782 RepID=A0A8I6RNX0_CIMLE|nr:neurotactin [Cimex lectularius]XP_024085399.1 neurotactin [Cimex lectularius]